MPRGKLGSDTHNKKVAQKRERDLADKLGGRTTPNSGATEMAKGDVRLDEFLVDDKFTKGKSIIVDNVMVNKISKEAREIDKEPMLTLKFFKGITLGTDSEWAVLPLRVLQEKNFFNTED